jgi:L-iditol 2-dehydrogenase
VDFWRNEITLTSSYGAAPDDLKEAIQLIDEKKVNVKDIITHSFKLTEIQKGFDLVSQADNSLKVVITP